MAQNGASHIDAELSTEPGCRVVSKLVWMPVRNLIVFVTYRGRIRRRFVCLPNAV